MGHLRDLPKSQFGVDIENNFEPRYINVRGKAPLINALKKEAKAADKVLLATDPDREGEAIAWHLAHLLGIDIDSPCRIAFNEVTKTAVKAATKEAKPIDKDLVDAQQARRILDRIVGYQLSPLLWKKVKRGLSTGRVQGVSTRLIVDREAEIDAFVSEEYWTIDANLTNDAGKLPFTAKFHGTSNGKKFPLPDEETVRAVEADIKGKPYTVATVKKSEKLRNPAPPFTTSTLQQEASRKLNFMARRTMMAAQQLYEGIDIKGSGSVGLITYMRTDSLRISTDAQSEARAFISGTYGKEFVPDKPRFYKSKKSAQDAHEAIRPTSMEFAPDDIKSSLTADQYKLYKLIWNRFLASQMSSAILDAVSSDIAVGNYIFRATGSTIKFAGFMKVYIEGKDNTDDDEKEGKLPALAEGQTLKLKALEPKQHFTQPPPRFTEATLIRAMEDEGIGRPSTYAPTITTITARGYVARDGRTLFPTELGKIVTELMVENFTNIVDTEFTANMEERLDEIESGNIDWKRILGEFYTPFAATLAEAEEKIGTIEIADEESEIACEKCGRMLVYKQGRFGKFLACPGYPECKNTKSIVEEVEGVNCPKCSGAIHAKKSKKGVKYYGCEKNPECDFMTWDEPTAQKCPQCGDVVLKKRAFRGKGPLQLVCNAEACDYKEIPPKKKEE